MVTEALIFCVMFTCYVTRLLINLFLAHCCKQFVYVIMYAFALVQTCYSSGRFHAA